MFVVVVVLFSCNTTNEKGVSKNYVAETINLNGLFCKDCGIDMSELIDSLHIVKLETTEESIVGNINKIVISTNGNYIIGDDVHGKGIIIFDKDGNFIKRLSNGNGTGELRYYVDFDFDYNMSLLLVGQGNYMMKFDENGNFLGNLCNAKGNEIQTEFYYSEFKIQDDGLVFKTLVNQNTESDLAGKYIILTDYDCKVQLSAIDKFLKYNYNDSKFDWSGNCFSIPMSDTIYSYTNGQINPKYVLAYSDYKECSLDFQDFKQFMKHMTGSDKYFFDGNYQETVNTLFISMMSFRSYPVFFIINKKTKQIKSGDYMLFNHKYMPSFSLPIATTRNGYFVSLIDNCDENKKLESSNLVTETERSFVASHSEDDNPLIVLLKFKQ